jgi:hypothetical protein
MIKVQPSLLRDDIGFGDVTNANGVRRVRECHGMGFLYSKRISVTINSWVDAQAEQMLVVRRKDARRNYCTVWNLLAKANGNCG